MQILSYEDWRTVSPDVTHHSSPRAHHESKQCPWVPVKEEASCSIYVYLGGCFQIPYRLHKNSSLLLFNCTAVMTSKKAARFCCHSCISHRYFLVLSKPTCTKVTHPQSATGSTLYPNKYLMYPAETQCLPLPQFRCSDPCNGWAGQGHSSLQMHSVSPVPEAGRCTLS